MTQDFLERIFEPFERADDEAIRSIPGTGLGMAISKNIVEMLDGTIQVESTYGKGSKFTATFCLRLQEQPEWNTASLAGLPILVVDDDEIVCVDQLVTGTERRDQGQIPVVHHQVHDAFDAAVQVKGHIVDVLSGGYTVLTHCSPPSPRFPAAVRRFRNPYRHF